MSARIPATVVISGARINAHREQEIHQALMICLAHALLGETDDVTITFNYEEF